MECQSPPLCDPLLDLLLFVETEIVNDDMKALAGMSTVEIFQKVKECSVIVPVNTTSGDIPIMDGERRKKTGCSVPFVGRGLPFGSART